MAPVSRCEILSSKWTFCPQSWYFECMKKRQVRGPKRLWQGPKLLWLDNSVRASPKFQFLWVFLTCRGQHRPMCPVNCQQGDEQLRLDELGERRLIHVVQRDQRVTSAKTAKKVTAGSDGKESEPTMHKCVVYGVVWIIQDTHVYFCPPPEVMDHWASEMNPVSTRHWIQDYDLNKLTRSQSTEASIKWAGQSILSVLRLISNEFWSARKSYHFPDFCKHWE